MSKISYFTEEGLSKLKNELRLLKTSGRKKIAQQIADARDKGDLSENAEYDAAKEAQGLLEQQIKNPQMQQMGQPRGQNMPMPNSRDAAMRGLLRQ